MSTTEPTYEIAVAEIAAVLTKYNQIRVYTASSRNGTYSQFGSALTLVAGTTHYTVTLTSVAATAWVKHQWFHSGTLAESPFTEPVPVSVQPTYGRQELVRRIANRLGCYLRPPREHTFPGPSGTTTSTTGSATTLADTEYNDGLLDSEDVRGYHLLINDGTRAGDQRRVSSIAAGVFTMAQDFGAALAQGVTFDGYGEMPVEEWRDALARTLKDVWVPFRFPVAGKTSQKEWPLPHYLYAGAEVLRVRQQVGDTQSNHNYYPTVAFELIEEDGGGLTLLVPGGLATNAVYWVEGRRPARLMLDATETLILDDQLLEIVVAGGAQRAALRLAERVGPAEDRKAWAERAAALEVERRGLVKDRSNNTRTRNARQGQMIGSSGRLGSWRSRRW